MRSWLALVALAGCGRFGFESGFSVDQSPVDVAALPCGESQSAIVTLRGGDVPVTFTAIADTPGTVVVPDQGTVAAHQDLTLTLTATADAVAIPGTALTGELIVVTDDAATGTVHIPVSVVTVGAVITTDVATLDFGQVTNATSRMRSLSVENVGNAAVTVSLGQFPDPGFSVTSGSLFDLAPGATQSIGVQFDPTATQTYASVLPLAIQGATCDAVPVVDITGAGTNSTILLDRTVVDFGAAACGAAAAATTVNVTNGNSMSFPFTATVTAGATSFAASPTSGTLPGAGMVSIQVNRAAVPALATPGQVNGNLNISITGAPNGTTNLPLRYTVTGSRLSASPSSYDFGRVMGPQQTNVTITNTGNQIADVQVTRTGSTNYSAPTSFQIPANSNKVITISFSGDGNTMSTADFTLTAANACSPPLTIQVTGTGKGGGP